MSKKISLNKFLALSSFLVSFLALLVSVFYKFSLSSSVISVETTKNTVILVLTGISLALYLILLFRKKEVFLPEGKLVKSLLIAFPVLILLSSIFSENMFFSIFGKYVYLQSGLTYLAIFCLIFILASYAKQFKRLTWSTLVFASLFVTIPAILAVVLSKFGLFAIANKLAFFIENWDIVSIASAIIIILSLIYLETIASTKSQKTISSILVLVHLILISLIVIPDIWYALALSSLFILFFAKLTNKSPKESNGTIKNKKFFEKTSFYVFLISLAFSVLFIFASGPTSKIAQGYSSFVNKVSGINYNFIKPNIDVSANLIKSELLKGKIFGSGPADFYRVWQQEKPQSVVDSSYWGVEFSSSFSAITTLAVTFGVIGLVFILLVAILPTIKIFKEIKKISSSKEDYEINQEEMFYTLATAEFFIFSLFLILFFANINISILIFALALALVLGTFFKWEGSKPSKGYSVISFLIFLLFLFGIILSVNRIRSTYITNNALKDYQQKGDLVKLEKDLTKGARLVQNNDYGYRLLTQFYLFNTGLILNSTSTDVEFLQKEVLSTINKAIISAKTAVDIDKNDFNNHISLGSVYAYLMNIDKENRSQDYEIAKQSYNTAISLYPKNPSIYLNIADLEYAYDQSGTSTAATLQKSLEVKPNYSAAHYLFSQLAAKNNDKELALAYAAKALESDPQNIDAYLQFGILTLNKTNLTQDDLNQAYTAFVSALTINPNSIPAAYYLAITYTIAKDYEKASELVNTLDKVLPEDKNIQELKTFLLSTSALNPTDNQNTEVASSTLETATTTAR